MSEDGIYDGCGSLREYLLHRASIYGLRLDDNGKPIIHSNVEWCSRLVTETRNEILEFVNMNSGKLVEIQRAEIAENLARAEKYSEERRAARERANNMYFLVEQWQAPSENHVAFKEAALERISQDLNVTYHSTQNNQVEESFRDYRAAKLAELNDTLSVHEKNLVEAKEKYASNKAWADAFMASLPTS